MVERAWRLAGQAHANQIRKSDGVPYVLHPAEVAGALVGAGLDDDELIAAALLHDVVEDSDIEAEEISAGFGPDVAGLVAAMTENEAVEPYERRKEHHRDQVEAAGVRAVAIYAADKLSKLRETVALYQAGGEGGPAALKAPLDVRVRLWRGDAEMIRRVAPRLSFLPEFESELEAFQAARPDAETP